MSKRLILLSKFIVILCISFVLSFVWWNLWMYSGLIGPISFLHWFIAADGEFSYDLTQYEMFIHLIVIISIISIVYVNKSKP